MLSKSQVTTKPRREMETDLFLFVSMNLLQLFEFPLKCGIPLPLGLRALLHLAWCKRCYGNYELE